MGGCGRERVRRIIVDTMDKQKYNNLTYTIGQIIGLIEANCIPYEILQMDHTNYTDFLAARRAKMTALIKDL